MPKKPENKQGDHPQRQPKDGDANKRSKDLEPEKDKGRKVKGGGIKVRF